MLIFNSKTKTKEEFTPNEKNMVRAYVCGPTVYDLCHLGHARSYICFDVLKRFLISKGYEVIHVQNFTDIDDKIIKKAKDEGVSPREISERYISEYFKDMDSLNVVRANKYTKVTDYIEEIAKFIEKLLKLEYAYRYGNEIYFDVEKAGGFGELIKSVSDFLVDDVKAEGKKGPFDFILWKFDEKGFESKIGRGFPGWHIECVVMSMNNLGENIDIHWGGKDLIYPHHECESLIAKTLIGRSFVKYWVHNGLILFKGRKMSKSSSSKAYIREIIKEYSAPVIRIWILSKHYREDMNFSEEGLNHAQEIYMKIKRASEIIEEDYESELNDYFNEFISAMNDDLNTEKAIKIVEEIAEKKLKGSRKLFKLFEEILGIKL